jgi:hypothetical protein
MGVAWIGDVTASLRSLTLDLHPGPELHCRYTGEGGASGSLLFCRRIVRRGENVTKKSAAPGHASPLARRSGKATRHSNRRFRKHSNDDVHGFGHGQWPRPVNVVGPGSASVVGKAELRVLPTTLRPRPPETDRQRHPAIRRTSLLVESRAGRVPCRFAPGNGHLLWAQP